MKVPEIKIVPYCPEFSEAWDEFVRRSKNATFLHLRGYMDYHSDRFPDASLMIWRDDRLHSLFPATARPSHENPTVSSHDGLSFASLLTDCHSTAADVLTVFTLITDHYRLHGYKSLSCRPIPHIYHSYPAEEELYALFRLGATLSGRQSSVAIPLSHPLPWRRIRLSGLKKADKANLQICEENSPRRFWPLLETTLAIRHNACPVHSVDEISLLASRFPENIRTFTVRRNDDTPLAGVVIYVSRGVAHTQYIATSSEGRQMGALDHLIFHLVTKVFGQYRWFDFGTSNLMAGHFLNENLIYQKEGFGARTICQDTYTLSL